MRHRMRPALAALMVGSLCCASCTSYRQIEPADILSHEEIRITTDLGYEESLWEPQVHADTLIGRVASGDALLLPLDNIQDIEARKIDVLKTTALVVVTAGLAAVAYLVVAAAAVQYSN